MERTEPAATCTTTGRHENQEADNMLLMSSKPLHRFVQREPKYLGIAIVIFGCAELLMGFNLAGESSTTSYAIYIPLWQGVLFLLCGNLSIYTERRPSKKMVTVCLAMYLVSFFGSMVSFGYRIFCFIDLNFMYYRMWHNRWHLYRVNQLLAIEGVLFTFSLCVSVLLIFLCCVARLALKSTRTQVIVQCVRSPPPPQSGMTSN